MLSHVDQALQYLHRDPHRVAEICRRLVRFDTVFEGPGASAHQERACQEWIAGFLAKLGFEIDQWEPSPAALADHPMYQPGLRWEGRPITVGTLAGTGGGRSLILNGHIDTVSAEPIDRWTFGPWEGSIVGDRLYGRGSADMKGGIAAALAAVEAAVRSDVRFAGDLIVQVVSDEETTGMGTIACIERGYRADGCLVPEPTSFETWVAYRGILYGSVRTEGRPAHAEIPQPHWRVGGGVSGIDAMRKILDGLDALNAEWRGRPDQAHRFLAPPSIVVTGITGGEFIASIPAHCHVDLDVTYLPGNSDEAGYGGHVRREIEEHIMAWSASDPWLREHPPRVTWLQDYPPADMAPDHAFIQAVLHAAIGGGVPSRLAGLNSWADAASYARIGVPAACFGPGSILRAHTVDEWVSISDLRTCAEVIVRLLVEWCGAA